MQKDKLLIYGAGGYMGKLFAKEVANHSLPVVLAARSVFEGSQPRRIFSLSDQRIVQENLLNVKLVVNLAGPFATTNKPLIEACLATGTHYIDIAGEVPEFETVYAFNQRAKEAGIMLLPGAGFGVVPTDIVANLAKQKLLDAIHLKIAYVTVGGASRGTLKTVLKGINKEGVQVVNGHFVKAAPAKDAFRFTAEGKRYRVVYNPWRGDLFTAQKSTGIANIETYANFPGFVESMMKGKLPWLRKIILKRLINLLPVGPSEKALQKGKTICYAEVINSKGEKASVTIVGPEAYLFTAQTLLTISKAILNNHIQPGFQTPNFYGIDLLNGIATVH